MTKKKFSPAQIRAQKLFSQRSKAGTLRKKSKSKKSKTSKSEIRRLINSKNKGTDFKRSNIDDSLLQALHDPNVKEIIIRK